MRVHHCSYWAPLPMDYLMPSRCMKAGLSKLLLEFYSHVPATALDANHNGIDLLGRFLHVTNQPEIRNPDLSLLRHILEVGCNPNTAIGRKTGSYQGGYDDPSKIYGAGPEFHNQNGIPTIWTVWLGETFIRCAKTESTSEKPKGMLKWRKQQAAAMIVLLLQHGADPHCMVCLRHHSRGYDKECCLVTLDQLMDGIALAESVSMLRNVRELCSDQATGYVLRRNQRRRALRSIQISKRLYGTSAKNADAPEHHNMDLKLEILAMIPDSLAARVVKSMANVRHALCNRCLSRKCTLLVVNWCLDCGRQSILCSTCLDRNPFESRELGYPCGGYKGDHGSAIGNHTCVTTVHLIEYRTQAIDQALEGCGESLWSRRPTVQAIKWYARDPIEPDLSFEDVVRNTRMTSAQPPHIERKS